MSFKPQVRTGNDPKFYGNALAFATYDEAHRNARDLAYRWMLVVEFRTVESTDPISHAYSADGVLSDAKPAEGDAVTAPHTPGPCVKGAGFDADTGGFTHLLVDGARVSVRSLAAVPAMLKALRLAEERLIAIEHFTSQSSRGTVAAIRAAVAQAGGQS